MRALLLCAALTLAVPAVAQDLPDAALTARRVGALEAQMRAVQRKVFPGGDPKFFTPDIAPAAAAPPPEAQGNPASAPLADLNARVDALERQLRSLTGQVEENQNAVRQLTDQLTKLRGDSEFRLNALEGGARPAIVPDATAPLPLPAAKATKLPATKPDAKPVAGDPVEAAWRAAYAHYTAKEYDAAEAGFTDFLAANPKAARAASAQYWLGRSYAAHSSSAQAAKAFLDGYQKYPKGDHAADSLIGLGNALTALKKPDQACRALNELQSVYGTALTAAQKAQAVRARTAAKCAA